MSMDEETDVKNNNYIQSESTRKKDIKCTCACHDTILKNKSESKVTFCDTPKATEQSVEQSITYSEILILDSPPSGHKPIKRSPSLESRDNPFIPGGSLDKEAADILKRATIIRDQFILSDNEITLEEKSSAENIENNSELNNTRQDLKTGVTEETILPQNVNSNQTKPITKQNGKLEDKTTVSTDLQPIDNNQKDGTLDRSLKDKKKQKKCCSVM